MGRVPEMSDDEKLKNFARYQRDFEREEQISASRKWWIIALVTEPAWRLPTHSQISFGEK